MSAEDPRETFERRLVREILGAERVRARLLFAIPTLALFALVVVGGPYPETVALLLHGRIDTAPVGLFLHRRRRLRALRPLLDPRPARARRGSEDRAAVPACLRRDEHADGRHPLLRDGRRSGAGAPDAVGVRLFDLHPALDARPRLLPLHVHRRRRRGRVRAIAFLWGTDDTRVVETALSSVPHHLGKAVVLLVSGVAAGFVARRLRKSFTSAIESVGERARILGVFGQHVSPEVVERLIAGKTEVKSEIRTVCVMFLDIRNFTAFAENKSPGEVVDYLNDVFEATIDAVVSRHGIVNKFLGDGYMAVFGAPFHEENASRAAVAAALDIVERIERLVADGKIPPTQVGIGLHTGDAVVGNIGSAQRREYTVIGDVVNVASRIESLNKELRSQVLVSDETWTASGRTDVEAIAHDAIQVRGRKQPVRIWQLV